MTRPDIPRTIFNCTCIGVLFLAGVLYGAWGKMPSRVLEHIRASILEVYEESGTLSGLKPVHFLQHARHPGEGVTVNATSRHAGGLVLVTGFFETDNELRLMQRDGNTVARWPVRYSEIFADSSHLPEPPATDWNIDIHGAVAMPDGSVVFNFDYGGLVKLDRCGDVVWTLSRPTHHSVERAEGGGFWVPGRRFHTVPGESPFPPFEPPFSEDIILRVSEAGAILKVISVPQLLYDSGLESLFTSSGHSFNGGMQWDQELLHLNKIEELPAEIAADFPQFEAGDLALSLRTRNLLMVIDPDTEIVKWWRIGPWIRQHDPEFRAGGTIVLFNNNVYRTLFGWHPDGEVTLLNRRSAIMEINPATGAHNVIYGSTPDERFQTVIRGKVELTPRDGLLVTEFEGGRVFETDAAGRIVWEFVNRYDEDHVAEVTGARLYPESYFNVSDWSCDR